MAARRTYPGTPANLNSTSFLERLLDRPPISIDAVSIGSEISGRVVLVTGAGGSLGSALSRRVVSFAPKRLLLLEGAENNLFELELELTEKGADLPITPILGDVCDELLLDEIFAAYRPQIVFHAAAFKHVPLLERHPLAAVRNNVLGAYKLAKRALRYGARSLVMISTDKAVNPASVAGVSKRLSELILLAMNSGWARLTSVRLCNVIGSRGSVIPRFIAQISRGGPITVTHPNASRYFLRLSEAVDLILAAAPLGVGGDILVPDPGRPIRIIELVEKLIRLAGLMPGKEVAIVFTGLRSGEKLCDELLSKDEAALPTEIEGLRRVVGVASAAEVEEWVGELEALIEQRNSAALVEKLCRIVPEYRPSNELLARARSPIKG